MIFRCCFIETLLAAIFSAALTLFLNKKRWQNKKRLEMQNRDADFLKCNNVFMCVTHSDLFIISVSRREQLNARISHTRNSTTVILRLLKIIKVG